MSLQWPSTSGDHMCCLMPPMELDGAAGASFFLGSHSFRYKSAECGRTRCIMHHLCSPLDAFARPVLHVSAVRELAAPYYSLPISRFTRT